MGGPTRSCILHPPNAHARPSGLSTDHSSLARYVVPPQRPALRYNGPQCSFSTLRSTVHGVKETAGIACLRCPLVHNATIRNRAKHRYRIEGCNVNHCQLELFVQLFQCSSAAASFSSGLSVYCPSRMYPNFLVMHESGAVRCKCPAFPISPRRVWPACSARVQ
jgi:hypothetical protein